MRSDRSIEDLGSAGVVSKFRNCQLPKIQARLWRTIGELHDKVDQRLAALEEKIAATLPEGRREFQFARERDTSEVTDLPNPLPPRRAIN